MAESVLDQALSRIKTDIAAITSDSGTTYWYAPTKVWVVSFFEDRFLDTAYDHVVLIRPGEESDEEYGTGGVMKGRAEVFILTAKRFNPPTEIPSEAESVNRSTLVNRMVRDVIRALMADPQLNGLVVNVASEPVVIDREREVEGWAMAELKFVLSYIFNRATP